MDGSTLPGEPYDLTGPLAGRQQEQRALIEALGRCLRGYGTVVLISGEAGIGKTTLGERLVVHAGRAGARAVTGRCYNLTAGQPYGPWIDIVPALAAEAGYGASPVLLESSDSSSGPQSKEELFARVGRVLHEATERRPIVLLLEDIHWADHASLELLRHIARRASDLPLLLAATFRDDEPEAQTTLPRILPELIRESRAERLELQRLTLEDIQELLNADASIDDVARPAIARYLFERGDGNPFFINELLRDVTREEITERAEGAPGGVDLRELPVPPLVRQVIENRVLQLSSSSRALLNTAAVIGQEVPVDLWLAVTGAGENELADAIEEAIACHLLDESSEGGRVRFVHGLIQETLYRGQIALRRRARHQEIASYLADQPHPSPDLVALHFDRAGDERAVDWLVRAAEHAGRLYASPDAIRYVDRAIELSDELPAPLPPIAYRIRAMAYELIGEFEQAMTDYASLLQLAREGNDRPSECQTLTDLGLLWAGQDYERSGEYLQQALEIARGLDDEPVHAHCLNRVANWQANKGRFGPAIVALEESLTIFERLHDLDGIAETLDLLGSTHYLAGNYRASVSALDGAIQHSRRLGDKGRLASSLANLAVMGGDLDVSFDAGVAATRASGTWIGYGEESVRISREIGWTSGQAFSLAMLASVLSVRGELGRALALLEEAHELARRLEHQQWLVLTSLIMGTVWAELFDPSRAALHLERARSLAQGIGSHLWSRLTDASLAAFHAEHGDSELGPQLLERWRLEDETPGSHADRALRFTAGRVRLAAGDPDTALATAARLLALEEEPSALGGIPQVLKLKADALAAKRCLAEADQTYAAAARAAEILDYRAIHWRVLRDWSINQDCQGLGDRAGELRSDARSIVNAIADEIDVPAVRDRFRERALGLIDLTQRTEPPSPVDTFGLSPRQLEVLRLVASGLTDAEVAEQLYISPRTVARHLQAIYSRLNVNTRAGATSVAYKNDLIN